MVMEDDEWNSKSKPINSQESSFDEKEIPASEVMNQQQRNWTLTESPFLGQDDGSVVTSQPQSQTAARNGVVRVTEMLRQINNQEYNSHRRRESESEDERTDASISRRSSGADSGVGILSENELLEPDMDRPGSGAPSGVSGPGSKRQRLISEGESQGDTNSYSTVPMAGLPLVGAMMGLCLGGPVGVLAGAKLGGVAAVGGSILGYTGALVIKEQRELRSYIDDHYKREPELYVLSPKEETILNRRMSIRTPPEGTRHLPGQRTGSLYKRGPAGYRRPSSSGTGSCSSLPGSPASRRRGQSVKQSSHLKRKPTPRPGTRTDLSKSQPPNLTKGQYRRLGDLTPEEQRSVLALICNQGPLEDRTFTVTSTLCNLHQDCDHQVIITRGVTAPPAFTDDTNLQGVSLSPAEIRRQRISRIKARTSSLPDVLEEDSISVKSLTTETQNP